MKILPFSFFVFVSLIFFSAMADETETRNRKLLVKTIENMEDMAGPRNHDKIPMDFEKFLKTEKRAGIYAQKFIDSGEYEQANTLLEQAIIKYSDKDWIVALRGEALFLSKKIDQSEEYFMKALSLNQQNEVAKKYIEEIRSIRALSSSEGLQEWILIAKDKAADFVVLVLGIWLGTTINTIASKLRRLNNNRHIPKLLSKCSYQEFSDIMVDNLIDNNIEDVRHGAQFMLKIKSFDECVEILNLNVDRKQYLQGLVGVFEIQNRNNRA